MPIKGLTDAPSRLPIIGRLYKGAERQTKYKNVNGKQVSYEVFGQELDYFRFSPEDPGNTDLANRFIDTYGAEPKLIIVRLAYSDISRSFSAFNEEYNYGGMTKRCDGSSMIWYRDGQGQAQSGTWECQGWAKDMISTKSWQCNCRPTMRLVLVLPELRQVGAVMLTSRSKNDCQNISAMLREYSNISYDGSLAGQLFELSRIPTQISTPGQGGTRIKRTKYLLGLEVMPSWKVSEFHHAKQMVLSGSVRQAETVALPEHATSTEAETEAVVVEDDKPHGKLVQLAQIACREFGFSNADRDLRLQFASRILGKQSASFKDSSPDDISIILKSLKIISNKLRSEHFRLNFVRYLLKQEPGVTGKQAMTDYMATIIDCEKEVFDEVTGEILDDDFVYDDDPADLFEKDQP